MNRGRVVPSAVVLAATSFAATVHAQSERILGQENAAFARSLFQGGYADLADGVCRVIEAQEAKGKSNFEESLEVKALAFDLRLDRARRENDLATRKKSIEAIIADANTFIQDNSRTKVADQVRTNIPNAYLELATSLTALLGREQDPAVVASLRSEGEKVFEEAKQSLRDRVSRFEKALEEGGVDTDYAQRQITQASFNLARMSYLHSRLYAPGSPEQKKLLEQSLKGFQDFGFENSQTLQYYQGIIYQGLCHEALGMTEDALTDYDDAIGLRSGYEPNAEGQYEMTAEEADVVSGATLRKVKLFVQLKRLDEAIATAADFLKVTPDPLLATSGPEVLAAKAEAELASGDIGAASASAQTLVDFDSSGWGGRTGREILGRLPVLGLSPDKMMRIADTALARRDYPRALDLCRQAREAATGVEHEADIGAESFLMTGTIYRWQGRLHEASAAFDCAAELYPTGTRTPEALYGSVSCYRELAKAEKSKFYSKRADERMNTLASKYPSHPLAANAGIWQGLRREDEDDFPAAIDFYRKIPSNSPSYYEAAFRLANAMYMQGKSLVQKDKRPEAAKVFADAATQYQSAIEQLEKAQTETLDRAVQQRLSNFAFSARTGLASLLIELGRAAEVQPLLAGLDDRAASDPDLVSGLWSLRIRALGAEGKLDEAMELFDALLQRSSDTPATAGAGGVLARALDQDAISELEKDPKSARAEERWRKAAHYYTLSVKSALEGNAPLRTDVVGDVAQRLYVIGLHFNGVPEGQQTFVDWRGPVKDPSFWEEAARIYDRLDEQAPSYRIEIERARTYAILGRYEEAGVIYGRLFDQMSLFAPGNGGNQRFDRAAVEARPELVPAYLEWGVTEHLVGLAKSDATRLDRAADIYERMLKNSAEGSRLRWQAKYAQIRLLSDRGNYEVADTALRDFKRTVGAEFDKGEYGFKEKFQALENELSKKVFLKDPPGKTPEKK